MSNPEQIIVPGVVATREQKLQIACTVHDGQAVLHFSEPREFIGLMPSEAVVIATKVMLCAVEADSNAGPHAIQMAMHLMDLVYELRGDLKPAGGAVKHELIERHRVTLTTRLAVVMNSLREKRKVTNRQLAKELVEICLKEIFS